MLMKNYTKFVIHYSNMTFLIVSYLFIYSCFFMFLLWLFFFTFIILVLILELVPTKYRREFRYYNA